MKAGLRSLGRIAALIALSFIALQLFFLLRIALMIVVDPQSTTFQRSEIWRLAAIEHRLAWSQEWLPYNRIAPALKRSVIASEDAGFVDHNGIEWDALEKAWQRNSLAEARAEKMNQAATTKRTKSGQPVVPKVVGGSTITQQLAKNLFLSGERSLLRKGQEFVITFMLEGLMTKQRILAIYLNNVEWGEGVFGAQAAAQHYFHVNAQNLAPLQAARLAVMLPAPKRFEKRPGSPYVAGRAATIAARMADVEMP